MAKISREKGINSKQAVRMAERFEVKTIQKHILENFRNGDLLFRKENIDTGVITDYFLYEIYIKKFTMLYSTNTKRKSGDELLISNFELPNGKIIN